MSDISDEKLIELLHQFVDWNVYNGAPDKGQNIYNEGGNPWLHDQVGPFIEAYLRERSA